MRQEIFVLMNDVVMDALEIRRDRLQSLVGVLKCLVGAFHDVRDDLMVEMMEGPVRPPVRVYGCGRGIPASRSPAIAAARSAPAVLAREFLQFLLVHRAVVFERDEPEPTGVSSNQNPAGDRVS